MGQSGDGKRRESLRASGGWMENDNEGALRGGTERQTVTYLSQVLNAVLLLVVEYLYSGVFAAFT